MNNLEFIELNTQELGDVNGGVGGLVIAGIIIVGLILSTQKAY